MLRLRRNLGDEYDSSPARSMRNAKLHIAPGSGLEEYWCVKHLPPCNPAKPRTRRHNISAMRTKRACGKSLSTLP